MFNYKSEKIKDYFKDKKVVFWGTGRIGRDFFQKYCVSEKIIPKPLFWCDSDKKLQGKNLFGVDIVSPEQMIEFADKAYLQSNDWICIITAAGCNLIDIVSFMEKKGYKGGRMNFFQIEALDYFSKNRDKVEFISEQYADTKSRELYRKIIDNMINGRCIDFSLLDVNQYFDNDVIKNFMDKEILVDAGVCNGEEIDKALCMNPNILIHAFEPDINAWKRLQIKYKDNPQVQLYPYALWNKKERMIFSSNLASPSSSRLENVNRIITKENSAHGVAVGRENYIEAVPLDDIIKNEVTFIKMDIEGAELNALKGAEKIIKKYHPKLAICIYHNVSDYVEIPLWIYKINPDYKFYFRQHSITASESVFYAV